MTKMDNSYQEDDEIEIVGDTELDKKNAVKVDKNFSKMTLKGQREAMEAFKSSTLYSTEEDEEEEEIVKKPVVKKGRKRKVLVEEDSDSDIEILDFPKKILFKGGEPDIVSEDEDEDSRMCVSITPMTNNNSSSKASPSTKNSNKKMFKDDLNGQNQDLVQVSVLILFLCFGPSCLEYDLQVKSASGKTMLVERSKLERVMLEKEKRPTTRASSPLSPVKRPNTRASRVLENLGANKASIKLIKECEQPEEIDLDEKVKVDLKRKVVEDDSPSRRLRRRG